MKHGLERNQPKPVSRSSIAELQDRIEKFRQIRGALTASNHALANFSRTIGRLPNHQILAAAQGVKLHAVLAKSLNLLAGGNLRNFQKLEDKELLLKISVTTNKGTNAVVTAEKGNSGINVGVEHFSAGNPLTGERKARREVIPLRPTQEMLAPANLHAEKLREREELLENYRRQYCKK